MKLSGICDIYRMIIGSIINEYCNIQAVMMRPGVV